MTFATDKLKLRATHETGLSGGKETVHQSYPSICGLFSEGIVRT